MEKLKNKIMKALEFPEQTTVIAKKQKQYNNLPTLKIDTSSNISITTETPSFKLNIKNTEKK